MSKSFGSLGCAATAAVANQGRGISNVPTSAATASLAKSKSWELPPAMVFTHVSRLIEQHTLFYDQKCLVLEGATNVPNPRITELSGNSMGIRPSLGLPGAKHETGLGFADEVEVLASDLLQQLFKVRHAEVRPLSGCQAVQAALTALTQPDDTIFSLPGIVGGHVSHHSNGVAGLIGRHVKDIPLQQAAFEIDLEGLQAAMHQSREESRLPRVLLVGSSLPLRSFPLKELRKIADDVGAKFIFDAAHVTGIIAGGEFQNLADLHYAHAITSSSYKSFGAGPGGFILTDSGEVAEKLAGAIFPGLTANTNLGRFPALCIGAADLMEFGSEYARQCVRNANALGNAIQARGVDVFAPEGMDLGRYTDSHMIAVDVQRFGGGSVAAKTLEAANILTSAIDFPILDRVSTNAKLGYGSATSPGIRLAVQELTRRGMVEDDMSIIASFVVDVLLRRREVGQVQKEVMEMRSSFNSLHFLYS